MTIEAPTVETAPPTGFSPWRGRIVLLSLAHAMGTGWILFGWVLDSSGNVYGQAWMSIAVIMLLGAAVLAQAFREGKQPDR